ncbi:MAG: PKD domain-containing protein [Bacteroidales bacterium]|nr:PKD domain-containing protein [Bacteroidales bacterium]
MKKTFSFTGVIFFLLVLTQIISCKKDEKDPDVIASFTSQVDAVDFKKVAFTNQSQNFSALLWDFGDNATSSETNPVHTYADLGDYTVTLTATSLNGSVTDDHSDVISILDPNAELTKLVGEGNDGKVWKLIRSGATGRYPLQVFQYNPDDPPNPVTSWWGMGLGNDELANRPCILNDEWVFFRDYTFTYDAHGDFWREQDIFDPAGPCQDIADGMINKNGEDCSAWGNGTHQFELVAGSNAKIKAIGTGAYIGYFKLATDNESLELTPMVQDEVDYDLFKLTDAAAGTDTLIVQGYYKDKPADAAYQGIWRFVLVHYDNPADEPPIPTNNPTPNFSFTTNGLTLTFTNNSQYCDSYLWDFGDGETSTAENPVHTYTNDGFYNISLSGTNSNGTATFVDAVFLSVNSPALTADLLQGAAWRDVVGAKTIFVGGALGSSAWWSVPKDFLTGGGTGGDDWSCMADDEYIFSAGVYTYAGNGLIRNDGYFGSPNGCWDEGTLTGNGLYFASGEHTYTFTPADGTNRAIIELTNGTDRAAFIGFYKGYYGGENTDGANAPNGGNLTNRYEVMGYAVGITKEYLFVSVDISAGHDGSAAWSVILER